MKTRFILFIAAIAGVALSCQKENNVITPEETPAVEISKEVGPNPNFVPTKSMTFVGTTDDEINAETKTSLDGNHIMWAASEGIYLFDGTAPRAFTSDNGSEAATVNFEGSAVDAANYYSVYPSGKISTVGGKKVIATSIPTFQTATANTFAPKANVAVAYATSDPTGDGALQFKNIGAVVKFKINASNTDVRKVRLDAIGGEDLSGAMNVTFESDGSFNTASVHAKSESCVILESDTDLNPANTYYMAVKPGTYADGFKITLIRENGSFRSINNTASITLARNDLMDFGDLPAIPSWKSATVDIISFATTGVSSGSSTYTDWSNKTLTSSAVYAGSSAGQNDAIQIRSKNGDSGVYTTASGGQLAKVCVEWNSNTLDGRTLEIYGKKSAYTVASDLFDGEKQGTLLGTIVKGTSTELTISGDYTFVGMKSNDGALFMDIISVYWGDVAPVDPDKTTQETSIESVSSTTVPLEGASATFNVVSNGPWTIASNQTYATVSVSETDVVTVTFDNLGSGQRDATITVTPAQGTPQSVTITQKDVPLTKLYTLTINTSNFAKLTTGSGYTPYNGDHVFTATAEDDSELSVTINSNQVMVQSSNIQFQKNAGVLYNKTDLGTITSISSVTSVTNTIGTTQNPSSGSEGGYFKMACGNSTATTSSITIKFRK